MPNFNNSTFEAAQAYVSAGLSIIPIDRNATKRPAYSFLPVVGTWTDGRPRRGWAPLMKRFPTPTELYEWYNCWGSWSGIAVVCGRISGGLEAIDIDSAEYAEPWLDRVNSQAPGLIEKLVLVRTPRPGLHAYFRCETVGRNEKLAQIFVPDESDPLPRPKTIIETRGEGGYVIIPPTPGYCHPSGRPYEYVTEASLLQVQCILPEERAILFEVARSFHIPPVRQPVIRLTARVPKNTDRRRPGDDFNYRASWQELLERHGWSLFLVTSEGVQHWTRLGKPQGTSATVDFEENNLLHVFTSNASPLEEETSYSKFHFVTVTEHQGNFEAAARALSQQGYCQQICSFGSRTRRRPSRSNRQSSNRRTRRRR